MSDQRWNQSRSEQSALALGSTVSIHHHHYHHYDHYHTGVVERRVAVLVSYELTTNVQ